jgi:exopolysaccharide production protein ExoY
MMNDLPGEPPRRGLHALLSLDLPASGLALAAAGDAEPTPDPAAPDPVDALGARDPGPLGGWPKRLADILISVTGLVLAAPLMAMVAILISLTDRGPVLFAHNRVGFRGRPFRCYKFRTMTTDGDAVLEAYLAANPDAEQEWRATQKLRHDPRVNFVGRMLRKSSIDELPQLFNVLRGDMSCVGPRPVVRAELDRYGSAARYYLRTRPGLTGLWQVTGRSSTGYDSRVMLDTEYVRGWSVWADLVILCRTPLALTRFGEVS